MIPEALEVYVAAHQNGLWLFTVGLELAMTVLMYHYFGKMGLYSVITLNIMLSNLVGPKITTIFGMDTSMGVIFYSGIYFATDLLSERYGKREANRAVILGFAASVGVVVIATISLLYVPTQSPEKAQFASDVDGALHLLFGYTPRFVFGSLLAYIISQTHDVWLYHKLKDATHGKHLWLRNNVSTIASQAIDTAVYSLVVWWAIFDLSTAISLALAKYVFKVIIALLDTPFLYWARRWDKRHLDWHDEQQPVETGL